MVRHIVVYVYEIDGVDLWWCAWPYGLLKDFTGKAAATMLPQTAMLPCGIVWAEIEVMVRTIEGHVESPSLWRTSPYEDGIFVGLFPVKEDVMLWVGVNTNVDGRGFIASTNALAGQFLEAAGFTVYHACEHDVTIGVDVVP